MNKDRKEICDIISEMLDNPDEHGLYPTTRAYDKLDTLVHAARIEAIKWARADACMDLDDGPDEPPIVGGRITTREAFEKMKNPPTDNPTDQQEA